MEIAAVREFRGYVPAGGAHGEVWSPLETSLQKKRRNDTTLRWSNQPGPHNLEHWAITAFHYKVRKKTLTQKNLVKRPHQGTRNGAFKMNVRAARWLELPEFVFII